MDFSNLRPEEILQEDTLDEYGRKRDYFWSQIFKLNGSIFVLECLSSFPLWQFMEANERSFLDLTWSNFSDAAVLTVTKLVMDKGKDIYTIKDFENDICRKWIKANHKEVFQKHLKQIPFDKSLESLYKKAKNFRKTHIAHELTVRDSTPTFERPSLLEIKTMRDEVASLFKSLVFGDPVFSDPILHSPYPQQTIGSTNKSDIEDILGYIAANSRLVNDLRHNEDARNLLHQMYPEDEIRRANVYLRKLGLPEI